MGEYIELMIRMAGAIIIGAVIGYERSVGRKSAGIRTHMIVCITAASLVMASLNYMSIEGVARIVQGIITGIGFLGAGAILVQHMHKKQIVTGLTTAASIWAVAILGVIIGLGQYAVAGAATLAIFVMLELHMLDAKLGK